MNIIQIKCYLEIPRSVATWQWVGNIADGEKRFEQRFDRKPEAVYTMGVSHWFVVGLVQPV